MLILKEQFYYFRMPIPAGYRKCCLTSIIWLIWIHTLILEHQTERDRRIADRIKAVVLHAEVWSNAQIAQALLIHVDTVGEHLADYVISKKLKPENGGSDSRLDVAETKELAAHIEEKTYTKVADLCAHVKEVYGVSYTVSGMTNWLQCQGFSYKQLKGVPAKADAAKPLLNNP
jgi:transposase